MIRPPSGIFSGSTLLRSTTAPGTVSSSALSAPAPARPCSPASITPTAAAARSAPAAAPTSARPPGRRRAASTASPAARAGTSPTVVRPWPLRRSALGGAPEASQLPGLPAERGAQAIHDQERRPALPRHEPSGPKRCSGKVLGLIRLPSVPFLGAFSVGIARKRPRLAPDHRALVERADDLRRLGVDQARGVELLVRVVLVAPAVGEPLAEPGARDLPAELGPEAAAGVASAGWPPRARCRAARPACPPAASGRCPLLPTKSARRRKVGSVERLISRGGFRAAGSAPGPAGGG